MKDTAFTERAARVITGKIVWLSISLGVAYWLLDAALDSFVFEGGGFTEEVFAPEAMCLYMRLINWTIITGFALYAWFMLQERRTAEEAAKQERDKAQHLVIEMKRSEQEREKLIGQLQEALTEVRLLGSMLPICASCKKIRDDKGYWHQVEVYIGNQTGTKFSHGICPDCKQQYYDQLAKWTAGG